MQWGWRNWEKLKSCLGDRLNSKFLTDYAGLGKGGVEGDSPGSDMGNSVPAPDRE